MSERMAATLAHIEPRAVLVGSLGRAAALGDSEFGAYKLDGSDRDVDVIDLTGSWQKVYRFSDAAPLDSLMTRRLRPIPQQRNHWGLYTPWHERGQAPFDTIGEEVLQMRTVDLPFTFTEGMSAQTVGICAQIALHGILRAEAGPNLKHTDQVERLRSENHDTASCQCQALTETLGNYHAFVRQASRHTLPEKVYFWTRWAFKTTAPETFKKLQDGTLGQKVRKVRHTPEIQTGLPAIAELI